MSCGCSHASIPCSEFCACGSSCLNKSNTNSDRDIVYDGSDTEDDNDDEDEENDDI